MIRARRAVERVEEYVPQPEGRAGQLRLDLNENTVGCPPGLLRALRKVMTPAWCAIYPEYERSLSALARFYGVSPAELIVTNGADDAIMLICDTFVEPGDALAVPAPTFSIYQFFHEVAGGVTRKVSYDGEARLAVRSLIRAARGSRWLALANPNNPTGTLIEPEDLRTLLKALPRTLVLVDEAYFDFSGVTILPWIRRFPNLAVLRTFSKAFGLAALRIGLMFANRRIAGLMRRIHAVYAVNGVAAACAAEAIRFERPVKQFAREICRSRERFCCELERMGIAHIPSAANFVLTYVGPRAQEVCMRLRRQGILVRSWSRDPQLNPCLRITIGTAAQMRRMTRALEPLAPMIARVPAGVGAGSRGVASRWFA